MKAPEGTGIVVDTADIQNYECGRKWKLAFTQHTL